MDSREVVVSPLVSKNIELICDNICKHTQIVTSGCINIRKMTLFFKVDSQNHIKLLYCTDLKIDESGSRINRNMQMRSPVVIHTLTKSEKSPPKEDIYCENNLKC
jgi:hypothetical protein